jgi:hypothetical protein
MAKVALVMIGLAASLALTGCVSGRREADASLPSASIGPGLERLAGRWYGTLYETGGSLYQGFSTLELDLDEDGTWTGTIGSAPASGAARLEGNRLVVTGTAGAANGPKLPVYVELTGDDSNRWGQMAALFAGRRAPATIQLERAPATLWPRRQSP